MRALDGACAAVGAGVIHLILRRLGRGNWSPLRLSYDPARQGQLPPPVEARIGARLNIGGITYRVSRIEWA